MGEEPGGRGIHGRDRGIRNIATEDFFKRATYRVTPEHLVHREKQVGPTSHPEQRSMMKLFSLGTRVRERQ